MLQIVIAVVITLIVTAVLTYFITTAYHKNVANAKIGNAEDRAREIIDEAVKTAETKNVKQCSKQRKSPSESKVIWTKK